MSYQINIPEDMVETLKHYVVNKIPPECFTRLVLESNLFGALSSADEYWRYHIYELVYYIINYLPDSCYGSAHNVKTWLSKKD